jgi:LEA14-like dessication related protein
MKEERMNATVTPAAGPLLRLALPVLATLLLAGCAALGGRLETPRLSLVGIQLQDASFFEQRLLVRLRVRNPNGFGLPVRGLTVNFELDGEDFAQGVSARSFEVPAMGEAEFDMVVTANAATVLLRVFGKDRERRPEALDYRIRGKLDTSLGLLRSVPFDERGTLPLDALGRGKGDRT